MTTLTKTNGVPLYVQLRERLREAVAQMKPGEAIPTEHELELRFGVSRMTVRNAVNDLAVEGLLVRHQGRGTFVQELKLTHDLNMITSWTEQLVALGYKARTSDLDVAVTDPPARVGHELRLSPGERVFVVRRVRMALDQPITLMVNYLPESLVPDLSEKFSLGESLYKTIEEEYKLVPARAVDRVESRAATDSEAKRLRIEHWAPVLCVTRVSYLSDERPLEVAVAISRGDRYQYRVELKGRARGKAQAD
ncbi:MAG TPA: GntR family transcriptional regulator [Terriglobia bacterium]|nr:GntR family transcriptional regulator [Terriglobia bacterium]